MKLRETPYEDNGGKSLEVRYTVIRSKKYLVVTCPDCEDVANSLPSNVLIGNFYDTEIERQEIIRKIVIKGFFLVKHNCPTIHGTIKTLRITEAK